MSTSRLLQIQEMLVKEPKDSFLNYALALEHLTLNDIPRAISIIAELLQRDENYLGAYYQLGKLYEETQEVNLAEEIYKKGMVVAQLQKNQKTFRELNEALSLIR